MKRIAPDSAIALIVAALVIFGLVMIISSSMAVGISKFDNGFYFAERQLGWLVLGVIVLFVVSRIDLPILQRLSRVILILSLLLVLLPMVPGFGYSANGAQRWAQIGPITFQPSEIGKIGVVLYMAAFLAKRREPAQGWRDLGWGLLAAFGVGLVVAREDLGTAFIVVSGILAVLFLSGARMKLLFQMAAGIFAGGVVYIAMAPFRVARFLSFLNPRADPDGDGYHIVQGLLALGSGGISGLGLGDSRQKFFYLPEPHTDFIFAVIGEEIGIKGTLIVFTLFAALLYFSVRVAMNADDEFGKLLAGGLTAILGVQVLINLASVVQLFPVTGVPLPFISYGGSSLLVNMALVGLILAVSRAPKIRAVREREAKPEQERTGKSMKRPAR